MHTYMYFERAKIWNAETYIVPEREGSQDGQCWLVCRDDTAHTSFTMTLTREQAEAIAAVIGKLDWTAPVKSGMERQRHSIDGRNV